MTVAILLQFNFDTDENFDEALTESKKAVTQSIADEPALATNRAKRLPP
jgi:hypothetical protein